MKAKDLPCGQQTRGVGRKARTSGRRPRGPGPRSQGVTHVLEETSSEERHCLPAPQCREHTWGCPQYLTAHHFIAGEKGAQGQGSASRCRRGREEGIVPFHPQDELETIDLLKGPPGSCDQGLGSILRPEGSAPSTSGEIMV